MTQVFFTKEILSSLTAIKKAARWKQWAAAYIAPTDLITTGQTSA